MARGTVMPINRSMIKPILIGGVEKRLMMGNVLLSFPLIAATHFSLPAALFGVLFFIVLHGLLMLVSKSDPYMATLFRRSTRYSIRAYFSAHSSPLMTEIWPIRSISTPR